MTRAPESLSLSRLRSIACRASRSVSTKTAVVAPRESASSPIAPEPAKRSSTVASSTGPIRLKAASRARSEVGRVSCPFGAKIRAPFFEPAMILTGASRGNGAPRTCLWTKSHAFVAVAMSACAGSGGQSTRTARRSRQRVRLRAGEEAVDLVVQGPFVRHQLQSELARPLEQLAVCAEASETELREARLPRAEQLALPAQLQVLLCQLETVGRLDERLQPFARVVCQLLLGTRDEQAVGLLGAAADAAPQLVELGEPETIGLLDDHDRRVRNVDADLDHCRRDEHIELARLEARHQLAALDRAEPTVQEADPVVAELATSKALGLGLGCARLRRLRLLDQRADDVGLTTVVQVLTQPPVCLRRTVVGHPARHDRLAVGRRLRDLRHREVAVDGQRQRARDRRRRHVQDVRRAAGGEGAPLLDPEPVLLVDDRDREGVQRDAFLYQRERADQSLRG